MEMRRRVWWQIVILDTMHSEDRGTGTILHPDFYDVKMPANISDNVLLPEATAIVEQSGFTEMSFAQMSYQASFLLQKFHALSPRNKAMSEESEASYEAKQRLVRDTCQHLYHQFVEPAKSSDPLQLAMSLVAKVASSLEPLVRTSC